MNKEWIKFDKAITHPQHKDLLRRTRVLELNVLQPVDLLMSEWKSDGGDLQVRLTD